MCPVHAGSVAILLMDVHDESAKSSSETKKTLYDAQPTITATDVGSVHSSTQDYRLYKRRFVGLVGLESCYA